MAEQRGWIIDKRIPVAVIVTLFLQFGGMIWWVAKFTSQVETLTIATARLDITNEKQDVRIEALAGTNTVIDKRLTVIETEVHTISEAIKEASYVSAQRARTAR